MYKPFFLKEFIKNLTVVTFLEKSIGSGRGVKTYILFKSFGSV